MKNAQVFRISVRASGELPRVQWTWRAEDGTRQAEKPFIYLYQCVRDAEAHGYATVIDGKALKSGRSAAEG